MDELAIADRLARFRCFYYDGEVRGPVTLWKIREMIDFDELSPDVQVIREGKDFWKTFVETEREIGVCGDTPGDFGDSMYNMYFYVRDENNPVVEGPISSLGLLYYIRSGKLTKGFWMCSVGDDHWVQAALTLPGSFFEIQPS